LSRQKHTRNKSDLFEVKPSVHSSVGLSMNGSLIVVQEFVVEDTFDDKFLYNRHWTLVV
jgi:hypothetical protein